MLVILRFGARQGGTDRESALLAAEDNFRRALRAFEREVAWVDVEDIEVVGFQGE